MIVARCIVSESRVGGYVADSRRYAGVFLAGGVVDIIAAHDESGRL